ncbi:hypothetical protein [Parabacteroides sp. PF5-9]|uniref:hypothetical protein n=1 Tax=Parabacteroides sp. PF5-9 TaxID=1742404 RepID=UPI002474D56E|nr:hypothetical protein [Parabacteroides sp. PF5-9]MDH6356971.1 hypothetical protein [Parabacteroides sp. PF5-9]
MRTRSNKQQKQIVMNKQIIVKDNAHLPQMSSKISIEELNELLVKRAKALSEYVRTKRQGFHTSDILSPMCYNEYSIFQNIDSLLSCYGSTLAAALFCEKEYVKIHANFEALSSIVQSEKLLIFDFLSENGLADKFNEYVKSKE